jgi:hypothetical protein
VPARVHESLRKACTSIARRNLELHAELLRLIERFDAERIPVVLLKGMHMATAVYRDIAMRELRDMDLLVPREALSKAASVVADAGYVSRESPDGYDYDASHHHAPPLINQARVSVELHWNVTQPNAPYAIDPAALWRDAEAVEVFGRRALALSSGHLLLHLCMHAGLEHRFEFGLRPLCDVSALLRARADALQWPSLRQQAEAWGWLRSVSVTLRLAAEIGAAIPGEAAAAFGVRDVPEEVVEAAIDAALSGEDELSVFSLRMATRTSRRAEARKRTAPTAAPDGVRDQPESRSIRWTDSLVRLREIARRDGRMLLRLISRDGRLRSTMERQRRLAEFLSTGR